MHSILLQAQQQGQGWAFPIMMILMFGVLYFFMIRPQQKKAKDQKKFAEEIKKGDYVVTIGGAHGRVAELEGDTFILEAERGVRIRFSKSAISMDSTKAAAGKKLAE
ncbi:MAG: Protein translocase subunit YajC [Cytophagales bacterium]|mgnify:CR=1 FL=1|jgi:preprotein translocase subunit YajC|nr:preprotein translocase subunit YajC [Bacteroidota bacterium]MBS1979842.1 preprotein translocase subunit YajC [Bacteroidota bacterium]WHZ07128.1 MAG: Protein translocase subunit YajC [Cytophagales bacterium]